ALLRQRDARAVHLPAEIFLRHGSTQAQHCSALLGLRRMRAIERRFDHGVLTSPPVELVTDVEAQVGLVVPVEAEEIRRQQAVFHATRALRPASLGEMLSMPCSSFLSPASRRFFSVAVKSSKAALTPTHRAGNSFSSKRSPAGRNVNCMRRRSRGSRLRDT